MQLEYDNIEGMILLSELSRRRIRSIQKLIRVGRNEVVVVLRVDKEKGVPSFYFYLAARMRNFTLSLSFLMPSESDLCGYYRFISRPQATSIFQNVVCLPKISRNAKNAT